MVRAAQQGFTLQVTDAQKREVVWMLNTPQLIKGRVSDYRAIRGLSVEQVAAAADVTESAVRVLER